MTVEEKQQYIDSQLKTRQAMLDDGRYKFPRQRYKSSDNLRSFNHGWLVNHEWLLYSTADCGGYCLCCMLFLSQSLLKAAGQLVRTPLRNYKCAVKMMKDHAGNKSHKDCVLLLQHFRDNVRAPAQNILNQEIPRRRAQVIHNRAKLKPSLKTIILCGRQGLALRGSTEQHYYSSSASEKRAKQKRELKQGPEELLARTGPLKVALELSLTHV